VFFNPSLSEEEKLKRIRGMLSDPEHRGEAQGYIDSLCANPSIPGRKPRKRAKKQRPAVQPVMLASSCS
jgi:hypothetical protein